MVNDCSVVLMLPGLRRPAGRGGQIWFSMNRNTSSRLHRFTWAAVAPSLIALKRRAISAALRWPMRAERAETVMAGGWWWWDLSPGLHTVTHA